MTKPMRQLVAPLYLLLCLLLGGGAEGVWRNLALQLIGIVIIAWAAIAPSREPLTKSARQLVAIAGAALLLIALQLVPLPPFIWAALPGRGSVFEAYELLGQQPPWLPLSLTPHATISMLPWLIPPLAMLAAVLFLQAYRASWLAVSLVVGLIAGVLLGALQVSTSPSTEWYFHRIANFGFATGFFANKNHMAMLLLVTIPFLAALVARGSGGSTRRQRYYALLAAAVGVALVILVGLVLSRSLAGWGMTLPVLVASSLIVMKGWAARVGGWALGVAIALAAAGVASLYIVPVHDQLGIQAETSVDTRKEIFATSAQAAAEFAPFGSGVGSFVEVYRMYEDPSLVDSTYINHAHNDYLEIFLETGVPGLLLAIIFLIWWAGLAVRQWRGAADAYGRAASIATAVILIHSFVEYPLRTAALSAVFAMCIALMVQARTGSSSSSRRDLREARHLEIR